MFNKNLRITMPDGSKWDVPVKFVALDRAKYYAKEFDDNSDRSLMEDTMPLFNSDTYQIKDWAANNMDWDDVKENAIMVSSPECDYQEGWVNGEAEVV